MEYPEQHLGTVSFPYPDYPLRLDGIQWKARGELQWFESCNDPVNVMYGEGNLNPAQSPCISIQRELSIDDPIVIPFELGDPHLVLGEHREIGNHLSGEQWKLIGQRLLPHPGGFMEALTVSTRPGQMRIFYFNM